MTTISGRRTIDAGTRETYTWPVTLESGTVDALDAIGILVNGTTGAVTTHTATPTGAALVGTVAVTVTFPDTASGEYTLRLDVDDATGDLAADQVAIYVNPAAAQRPTP